MKMLRVRRVEMFLFAAVLWPGFHRAACAATSAANYSFSTATNASLADMSSGTTQLLGPGMDDAASAVTPIGFDFYYNGARRSQFSVNSNGRLAFGPGFSGAPYLPLDYGTIELAPFASDQATSTSGKVHFQVTGTAPNRVLVVEWLNMSSVGVFNGIADLTYQAKLHETTGAFEFVYGNMRMGSFGDPASNQVQSGFTWGPGSGRFASVAAPGNGTPVYDGGTAESPTTNTYADGPINVLSSSNDGARRNFLFVPPVPAAPANLAFTNITPLSMRINWSDSPDEQSYAIYTSMDGVNFSFAGEALANATFFNATSLQPGTTYTWRLYAVSEGGLSAPLDGTQATSPPGNIRSISSGNWSATTTWDGGAVPTIGDNVTIPAGRSVMLNTSAVAYSLTVAGTLAYSSNPGRSLTVAHDVTVNSGGNLSALSIQLAQHSLNVGGSLTNDGTLSFNANGGLARITFTGTGDATFGGTGATTQISTISVNKGSDATPVLELNPSSFSVFGSGAFLNLLNGTFKVSGTFSMTNIVFPSGPVIPATAGFWLNNPNFTVTGTATTGLNSGTLRISKGLFGIGVAGGSGGSLNGADGARFILEGGVLACDHGFSPGAVILIISGGTMAFDRFNSSGGFNLNAGASLTMSGGIINIPRVNPGVADYRVSGPATITGGILNIGSGFGTGNFRIAGSVPALVLNAGRTAQLTGPTQIYRDATINTGCTLNANGFTLTMSGTNLTNNGTLSGTPAGSGVTFAGSSAQTYSGTGTFGTLAAPFGGNGIAVSNPGGIAFNSDVITSTMTLTNGPVSTGPGSLIIPAGGSVFRAAGFVTGNLRRTFATEGPLVFDVGTAAGYSPVTANVTAATFPAQLTVKCHSGAQPDYPGITTLPRYWTITAPDGAIADLTFQYPGEEVAGDESMYQATRFAAGFTAFSTAVNTSAHIAAVSGIPLLTGDWFLLETDGDFDGMPTTWELAQELNPTNAADASIDSDGDDLTNLVEFFAGTDPHDANSAILITSVSRSGTNLVLHFSAVAQKRYRLECSDTPAGDSWTFLDELTPSISGEAQMTDTTLTTQRRRFYRVRLLWP